MGTKQLIDYRKLKARVPIVDLCKAWGIEIEQVSKSQLTGTCPLCEGSGFKVTPSYNSWKCFSCEEHGNILDLVSAIESCTVREVSVLIAERFELVEECSIVKTSDIKNARRMKAKCAEVGAVESASPPEEGGSVLTRNNPVEWALKSLDPHHESVLKAKISSDILRELNAGFCTAGSMKDRLALPYYDGEERLIGYCGVDLTGDKATPILFPPSEKFNPSLELFGTPIARKHVETDCREVFVVRHPLDALHMYSNLGIRNVVADRTPRFEHACMWEIEHIMPLPWRIPRAVFCLASDAA